MEELGIAESGLDRVIGLSYRLLGLISFLTAGPDEVRAWPIRDGLDGRRRGRRDPHRPREGLHPRRDRRLRRPPRRSARWPRRARPAGSARRARRTASTTATSSRSSSAGRPIVVAVASFEAGRRGSRLVADAVTVGRAARARGRRSGRPQGQPQPARLAAAVAGRRPDPGPHRARPRTRTRLPTASALARYLADAGLPVSPPVDDIDPGPHVGSTGRAMTLWRHLEVSDERADPAAPADAAAHPRGGGRLRRAAAPRRTGRGDRAARRVLAPHRASEARHWPARAARSPRCCRTCPIQALHGDAHLGNVVVDAAGSAGSTGRSRGAGRSPGTSPASSTAARRSASATSEIGALRGYGPYDADAVEAWLPVVALWAAAWGWSGEVEGLDWSEQRPNAGSPGSRSGSAIEPLPATSGHRSHDAGPCRIYALARGRQRRQIGSRQHGRVMPPGEGRWAAVSMLLPALGFGLPTPFVLATSVGTASCR